MRKVKLIALFMLVVILSPLCIPQSNFFIVQARSSEQIDTNVDDVKMNPFDGVQIKLAILTLKNDKSHSVSIKKITVKDFRMMTNRITDRLASNEDYDTLFEDVLQILKEYSLVDQDITLQDIFDNNMSTQVNTTAWNKSVMEPFMSIFSPVIIAGIGAGAGIGDTIGRLTGNIYSFGVMGYGAFVCLDWMMSTVYVLFTFMFPLVIHILSGFAGIMMFPVHFDALYSSGFPLFIYSNFFALGFSGLSIGLIIPYVNYTRNPYSHL